MEFILSVFLNAAVILIMARFISSITIKNFSTALGVALIIGLLNATVGFLFRLPLNLVTLFFLTFFVRLIVTAIMIKITDHLFSGFTVKGFAPALILAITMAVAGALFRYLFLKNSI